MQVPAGSYLVGDEKEPITIAKPFWLSKYPVTNSQYAQFIEAGGYECRDLWSKEGWECGKWGRVSFSCGKRVEWV